MAFTGLLVKESLNDTSVLERLKVTKEQIHEASNTTPDQPSQWTFVYFEGNDSGSGNTAKLLSDSLKTGPWYTNFTTSLGEVFVIFPGKFFQYRKGDIATKLTAQNFAKSIGIPEKQLDWEE
jgi:hypothetical protein